MKGSFACIYEKLCVLDILVEKYENIKKLVITKMFKEIQLQNQPEIFFSSKCLKNVNILKLIEKGKFQKVVL